MATAVLLALNWPTELVLFLLFAMFVLIQCWTTSRFLRRTRVLEELLGAKLYWHFSWLIPDIRICGTYRGREIRVVGLPICYKSWFILESCLLHTQRHFMSQYPRITENVYQRGNTLVCVLRWLTLGCSHECDRSTVTSLLDELIVAATIAEAH